MKVLFVEKIINQRIVPGVVKSAGPALTNQEDQQSSVVSRVRIVQSARTTEKVGHAV